ncbi:hypothetical protein [Celeribacter arenosi]|uniref:Uncharacterized protein n=1 Tax=Celeribacter arenosi TaxID=792649 RepID=A0ABP7KGM5_9RHOB
MTSSLTKSILAVTVAGALAAPAFAATDHIFADYSQDTRTQIELDLVRATADGQIIVYESNADGLGSILGEAEVHAGVNPHVKVNFQSGNIGDVVAVLVPNDANTPSTVFSISADD